MTIAQIKLNGHLYSGDDLKQLIAEKQLNAETWEKNIYAFIDEWFSPNSTISLKTSGSTGTPKAITFDKTQLIESAKITIDYFGLKKNQTALLCLPAEYVAAKMMVVRAIIGQLNLHIIEPTGDPFSAINQHIDFAAFVPLQMANGLATNADKLEQINTIIIGGGKLNDHLAASLANVKSRIFETYGMTETLTHVAVKQITTNADTLFSALPNISFETDERDCLMIHAPHISDKLIVTNDLVILTDKHQFHLIGRIDNVINTGGVKISIEDLENKLDKLIQAPFAITSKPDLVLGDKIVLVLEENQKATFLEELISNAKLNRFEAPKEVVTIEKIPVSNGKIERKKLSELIRGKD